MESAIDHNKCIIHWNNFFNDNEFKAALIVGFAENGEHTILAHDLVKNPDLLVAMLRDMADKMEQGAAINFDVPKKT